MIRLDEVSLRRGSRLLIEGASLQIHRGDRVGVIGANGCGKSSLFELLAGRLEPDRGHCALPADWVVAEMAQEPEATPRAAVHYVLDGHHEYRRLERALDNTAGSELGELHARFDAIGGWSLPARAHAVLSGLGFADTEHQKAVSAFSGGWRSRLALARTLLQPSDLLLLDEPTNHLDLDAIDWLEDWLRSYAGTLLLISHDRDFLDAVVGRVIAFEGTTLSDSRGNYSAWERQRAEHLAQQQAAHERQQRRVRDIEAFVARFRAKASKARQAQSRLKELERMQRIDAAHADSPFRFSLPCSEHVSTPLLSLERVCLGYGERHLLGPISLSLLPGQRVGLLGPNGAGKSTLVRHLAGELPALSGSRHDGDLLRCGYFAQHQLEALDAQASPLLHLRRLDAQVPEQALRDFLGGYGFPGDMALAPVGRFSGGERARLALALLAWQQPNLLLLDEPTNHLDLEMRHALVLALQDYAGAVLLVSHDRHLLRNSVDEFWLVLDRQLRAFDGDLDDYQRLLGERRRAAAAPAAPEAPVQGRREQRRQAAAQRTRLQPLRRETERLEREVSALHTELHEVETRLADPALYDVNRDDGALQLLQRSQVTLRKRLEGLESAWLDALEALERAQQQA